MASHKPPPLRKVTYRTRQAGMSGKEDERFKSDTVDSLEEKLRKRKSKADEQLEEVRRAALAWKRASSGQQRSAGRRGGL